MGTDTVEARRARLAAAWDGARDIYDAVRQAEAWPEEWAAIVIDAFGHRQYVSPTTYITGPRFTRYRGSSRRYPSREAAMESATSVQDAHHHGRRLHPWIRSVDVELVKTRTTATIGARK